MVKAGIFYRLSHIHINETSLRILTLLSLNIKVQNHLNLMQFHWEIEFYEHSNFT